MKLISLNTWSGKMRAPQISFLKEHAPSTDIFCFQEVSNISLADLEKGDKELHDNWFRELTELLPDFEGYFADTHSGFNWRPVEFDMSFGNAIFVRKSIPVRAHGHAFVYRTKGNIHMPELMEKNWRSLPRLVQSVELAPKGGVPVTIFNFHGLWDMSGKGDIPDRHTQAEKIVEYMSGFSGKKVLCGDFNLDIDNGSLKTLETGMRNLIKEFRIKTTRSKEHYPKIETMPYADYTLVSKDIEVKSFDVPDLSISDHLPMILEFA